VKIKIEKFNNELNINVNDNGIGIPEEKINNINSLGLTGMRERARYWNGEVNIKGTANKGTEVSIKLQLSNGDLV
jgi:signal transduction histidine kinase